MRLLAGAALVAAVAGALAPINPSSFGVGDKCLHVIAFAALAGLAARSGLRASLVMLASIALAVAIEILQGAFAPERTASALDAAASVAGAAAGLAAASLSTTRRLLAAGCGVLALGAAVDLAVDALRPSVTSALLEQAWRRGVQSDTPQPPWFGAAARPVAEIEFAGERLLVVDSAARRALAMAPGVWYGPIGRSNGATILLGHRNGAFARIDALRAGDLIFIRTLDGRGMRYRVIGRDVVRYDRSHLHPDRPGSMLVLGTCWPIGETRRTPFRLLVRAIPA